MHGAVSGAIRALKGPLHGGCERAAMDMLKEFMRTSAKGIGTHAVDEWMDKAFASSAAHGLRAPRLQEQGTIAPGILHAAGQDQRRDQAHARRHPGLEVVRAGRAGAEDHAHEEEHPSERGLPVRDDVLHDEHPVPQYTPIFVASRVTRLVALHVMEQTLGQRADPPLSIYTGPAEKKWNG